MNLHANSGRGRRDVRESCGTLNLKATKPPEDVWMAALYRAMVFGGEVTIAPSGEEGIVVEFPATLGADAARTNEGA